MCVAPLALRPGDEDELRRMAASQRGDAGLARRARIVLLAAEGLTHTEVAQRAGASVPTVRQWRSRYACGGIGALRDLRRSGRPKTLDKTEILVRTLEPPPRRLGVTHWSSRLLATDLGISSASVVRAWQDWGLQPWRRQSFRFSTEPQLEAKLADVVGLYLHPPDNAVVVCVDEKSQVQALDWTQPILPMRRGLPERATHDYIRHGVTTLLAALEEATGQVVDACYPRHRHQEFLRFLKKVAAAWPGRELHVVCDTYATHKHPAIRDWLSANPRVTLHFTPTGCSWLNMVEAFFSIIDRQAIRRGTFRSVKDLTARIGAFIDGWNQRYQPFVWTKSADQLLAKIRKKETSRAEHYAREDPTSLGEIAYSRVRHAIVRLELPPGAPVSEQQLVEDYGLTKASVRAALARLRVHGLVQLAPWRAHVVTAVTLRDVREVYELRLAIEPLAAESAAGRITARDLQRLRELTADPPDLEDSVSVDRFLTANRAVHVGVAAASGNQRLERIVSQLLDDSERVILLALRAGAGHHGRRVHEEHRALIAALEAADKKAARAVMASAIGGFRDELVDALMSSERISHIALHPAD